MSSKLREALTRMKKRMEVKHNEAFNLMLYACRSCMHRETVWNSRDGESLVLLQDRVRRIYNGEDYYWFTLRIPAKEVCTFQLNPFELQAFPSLDKCVEIWYNWAINR